MSYGTRQLQPDVNNLTQLSVVQMPSMSNRVGGIMPGIGLSIDTAGVATVSPATSSAVGGVKIGSNINVTADGTISVAAPTAAYVLPVATASVLGGIKDGTGVTVAADGTLSWDTTQTPPVTFNGLFTANGGITVPNNLPVGFNDPTNAFTNYQVIEGSGGNWNIQWRPNTSTAFANAISVNSAAGAITLATAATLSSTLAVTGAATFGGTTTLSGATTANASITLNNQATLVVSQTGSATGGYLQLINNGNIAGTGRNNPAIYSSGGNIDLFGNVYTTGTFSCNSSSAFAGLIGANANIDCRTQLRVIKDPYAANFYWDGTPNFIISGGGSNGYIYFAGNVCFQTPNTLTFGGNWTQWTPTLSAGSGTFTATAWYNIYYLRIGPITFFALRFAGTTNTATPYLYFTLPTSDVTPNNFAQTGPALVESAPAGVTALTLAPTRIQNPGQCVMQLNNNASWPVGAYTIAVSGFYRCA
jgi:hypothetical protein